MFRRTSKFLCLVCDFASEYSEFILPITVTVAVKRLLQYYCDVEVQIFFTGEFSSHSLVSPCYFYRCTEVFVPAVCILCSTFLPKEKQHLSFAFNSGDSVVEDSQGERLVPAGVERGTDGPGLLFGLVLGVRGELELDVGV